MNIKTNIEFIGGLRLLDYIMFIIMLFKRPYSVIIN